MPSLWQGSGTSTILISPLSPNHAFAQSFPLNCFLCSQEYHNYKDMRSYSSPYPPFPLSMSLSTHLTPNFTSFNFFYCLYPLITVSATYMCMDVGLPTETWESYH